MMEQELQNDIFRMFEVNANGMDEFARQATGTWAPPKPAAPAFAPQAVWEALLSHLKPPAARKARRRLSRPATEVVGL